MKVVNQISAGGIVRKKSENQVLWLICQHSQHHGWVFPKGFVGDKIKNETNETAALREVQEEGGIKARIVNNEPIETHYEYEYDGVLFKKTVFLFFMEYLSGDPKDHDWEMSDAKFVDSETVKKTLTYDSDKKAFEKILGGL